MARDEKRTGRVVLAKREAILKMLAEEEAREGDASERERVLPPQRTTGKRRGWSACVLFVRQLFSR
jgi:hypothetical protein